MDRSLPRNDKKVARMEPKAVSGNTHGVRSLYPGYAQLAQDAAADKRKARFRGPSECM